MSNTKDSESDFVRNFKCEELKFRVETYKYYLDIVLKVNVFFFVTTGAVIGFYLDGIKEQPANHLKYFLLLPILIGAGLGGIFNYAARLQKDASIKINNIKTELVFKHELEIEEIPDINLLYLLLRIFACVFFLVAASLIAVPFIRTIETFAFTVEFGIFMGLAIVVLVVGGCLRRIVAWKFDIKSSIAEINNKSLTASENEKGKATATQGNDLPPTLS